MTSPRRGFWRVYSHHFGRPELGSASQAPFTNNEYYSARDDNPQPPQQPKYWFEAPNGTPITRATWQGGTPPVEATATFHSSDPFQGPERKVGTYVSDILNESPATTARFIQLLRERGPGQWDSNLSARGFVNYIRAGFGLAALPHEFGPQAPPCDGHYATMLRPFSMGAGAIPQVSDTNTAYGCGEGRASVAFGKEYFLRVGASPEGKRLWYAYNQQLPLRDLRDLSQLSGDVRATTPCVSAANCNYFVAVWIEHNLEAPLHSASRLMCARFHALDPGNAQVFTLKQVINVQHQEHAGGLFGGPKVQHGAWDWVVPPSVACLDDGSFAVSYCDGGTRRVAMYSWTDGSYEHICVSGAQPQLVRESIMDVGGFVRYNHCVIARGASVHDTNAVIAFISVFKPGSGNWSIYFRTYVPNSNTCQFGRPYRIPTHEYHPTHLSLGPAFAHPAAFRPDGKLVVTWSRHADSLGTPGAGTVLGFSIADVDRT